MRKKQLLFGKATVTYLGKVVGRGCVKPIDTKVDAILVDAICRFLEMVG